jgi:crotonobetainyl-CoA:carnitine CoA-transferase CaiB-like acyl-CoA transferase
MLENLVVVELASVLAGPDVGMFFAEQGARVIKIENKRTGGDVTRNWKGANEDQNSKISAYFSSVNWNKEYLSLDLQLEEDKSIAFNLLKSADIVITNYKPGSAKKLGMDYDNLKRINPELIYGEINGYGSKSKRAAYDIVLQAETGFMSMNGTKESGPIKMPVALIDILAAHQLKEGLLLALMKKGKTGKGAYVEVSLYDAAISSLKNQATNWLMTGTIPTTIGSLHPNISPYGETFLSKDSKEIVLAIGSDKHFRKLLNLIKASDLEQDERYRTNQSRVINRKSLWTDLSPFFKQINMDELMKLFIDNDVPAGTINNMKEVFSENEKAHELVLSETINGVETKRVKTGVFKIS